LTQDNKLNIYTLYRPFINLYHKALYMIGVGYYMFLRQQVIWCPSVSEDNTKSRADLKKAYTNVLTVYWILKQYQYQKSLEHVSKIFNPSRGD